MAAPDGARAVTPVSQARIQPSARMVRPGPTSGVGLQRSIDGYSAIETGRDFRNRKRPTGDITARRDVGLTDVVTCIAATETFVTRIEANSLRAHGFWRLDDSPAAIWGDLANIPA
jgi:hypothetical protein